MSGESEDPRELARGALVSLRLRVDAHFEAAVEAQPEAFACAEGCSACCHVQIGVFELEAAPIREALAALEREDPGLRRRIRERGLALLEGPSPAAETPPACALLVDDRCAVYATRPLICRSHGLALLGPDGVDHCPLNFAESAPRVQGQLRLEALNRPLAVAASLYAGDGRRVSLASLAAELDPDTASEPG